MVKWFLGFQMGPAPGTVVVGRVATGSLVCGSRLVFASKNVEAQVRGDAIWGMLQADGGLLGNSPKTMLKKNKNVGYVRLLKVFSSCRNF